MAKSHHRKSYRRKDGTFVRGATVRGRNPQPGCRFWMIGMIGIAAVGTSLARRAGSRP